MKSHLLKDKFVSKIGLNMKHKNNTSQQLLKTPQNHLSDE